MRFMHISDLHIGKRFNEISLIEDQKYILNHITEIALDSGVDAVLIAGDVYDKSAPSAEAVSVVSDFFNALAENDIRVFVISGNHDSGERVAYCKDLLEKSGVYVSGCFDGHLKYVELEDEFGKIRVYLMPFVKPVHVRQHYSETKIESYNDAVAEILENEDVDTDIRNVILVHQNVVNGEYEPEMGGSEEIIIGGLDRVESGLFSMFDYTALGHIHKAQNICENIRYSGTPLKYSFSEVNHEKSVTIVDLEEKGNVQVKTIILEPHIEMSEIKGTLKEVLASSGHDNDYLRVILTDKEPVIDAIGKIRARYPNVLSLVFEGKAYEEYTYAESIEDKAEIELFEEFYYEMNGVYMSDEQKKYIKELIETIKEAGYETD